LSIKNLYFISPNLYDQTPNLQMAKATNILAGEAGGDSQYQMGFKVICYVNKQASFESPTAECDAFFQQF
jgi:hypothetical protein